jgi:hypothetical protein
VVKHRPSPPIPTEPRASRGSLGSCPTSSTSSTSHDDPDVERHSAQGDAARRGRCCARARTSVFTALTRCSDRSARYRNLSAEISELLSARGSDISSLTRWLLGSTLATGAQFYRLVPDFLHTQKPLISSGFPTSTDRSHKEMAAARRPNSCKLQSSLSVHALLGSQWRRRCRGVSASSRFVTVAMNLSSSTLSDRRSTISMGIFISAPV